MKKESLKDWCKTWDIEEIADGLFRGSMEFMASINDEAKSKLLEDEKQTLIKELKRRIK